MRHACCDPVRVHLSGAEHAFDCWEGVKMLIVAQSESNAHQVELAYSELVTRGSEEITAFVGRA
jgi:hypothetical protein